MIKNLISSHFDVVQFIPSKIVPRSGDLKKTKIEEIGSNIRISAVKCRKLILRRKLNLDKNDFIAIGLYLAEGTKYTNLQNKIKHSGEIAFVNSHLESIIIVCNLLKKFGIDTKSLKWKIGLNINFKNKISKERIFDYWYSKVGLDKNNTRPKWLYYSGTIGGRLSSNSSMKGCLHIFYSSTIFRGIFLNFIQETFNSAIIKKSKIELVLILKGFFSGDGSVDYSQKYNRKQVEFLNNDLTLLSKIRKSLKILGLKSIKETWPEYTKTHTKSLRIYNSHDFKILGKYHIPCLVDYKREKFHKILDTLC